MISIKSQKLLVTIFELELNVFILDPVVLRRSLQYFTILLPNINAIPLYCLLPLFSVKQVKQHPGINIISLFLRNSMWIFSLLDPEFWSAT